MGVNLKAFDVVESTVDGREKTVHARLIARQLLDGLGTDQRLALAGAFIRKEATSGTSATVADAPKTPDELWDYIVDVWNIKVARVAVCDDHDTPFDFLCAGFFEWFPNIFGIGPRGGGKSFDMALLHELNSRMKPGCTSSTFGAVDEQSKKVYQDMVTVFLNGGLPEGETEVVGEPTQLKTLYKNGSEVNCFPGTLAKVNGPHPPKVHSDEVEIMKAIVWLESRNMAASKTMPDGRVIQAQNMGTSTRKWKNGRVDKIYQEFLKVRKAAIERFGAHDKKRVDGMIAAQSSFYVYIWCIFEVAQQVPNCRCVAENSDLPEFDFADEDNVGRKCGCHEVVNGTWDKDGKIPRTLADECKGRFHRSRGHRSPWEVRQLFRQNDRGTWEAQQTCREADTEGLYVKSFSRRRHGLSFFPVDPANGAIYNGVDWGTTHFACSLMVQYLERAVEAIDYEGNKRLLPAGARVIFSEIYESDLNAEELGRLQVVREVKVAGPTTFARLPIRRRFADVQGAGDRKTWRKMGLSTKSYGSRFVSEHVKEVRGLYDADRAFVVVGECPHYCDEIEAWREDEKGQEVDENFNHAMAAGRYVFFGMHGIYHDPAALSPEYSALAAILNQHVATPSVIAAPTDASEAASEWTPA